MTTFMAQPPPIHNTLSVFDDDNMEISSDAGRHNLPDDDIDIDIDYDEVQHGNNDDAMIDEDTLQGIYADYEQLGSVQDDDMADEQNEVDGIMQDEITQPSQVDQDEELEDVPPDHDFDVQGDVDLAGERYPLDYDQNEVQEDYMNSENKTVGLPQDYQSTTDAEIPGIKVSHNDASTEANTLESFEVSDGPQEDLQGNLQNIKDISAPEALTLEPPNDVAPGQGRDQAEDLASDIDTNAPEHEEDPTVTYAGNDDADPQATNAIEVTESVHDNHDEDWDTVRKESSEQQRANADLARSLSHDIPAPLASSNHPVIVVFNGHEMNLFSVVDGDHAAEGLLNDRAIISDSLKDIFGSCRVALGHAINDTEELELSVTEMGLALSEDSNQADLHSLADILDIYVTLCQNDERIDHIEPLYLNLTTKYRFAARVSALSKAVQDGQDWSYVTQSIIEADEEPQEEDVGDEHEADIDAPPQDIEAYESQDVLQDGVAGPELVADDPAVTADEALDLHTATEGESASVVDGDINDPDVDEQNAPLDQPTNFAEARTVMTGTEQSVVNEANQDRTNETEQSGQEHTNSDSQQHVELEAEEGLYDYSGEDGEDVDNAEEIETVGVDEAQTDADAASETPTIQGDNNLPTEVENSNSHEFAMDDMQNPEENNNHAKDAVAGDEDEQYEIDYTDDEEERQGEKLHNNTSNNIDGLDNSEQHTGPTLSKSPSQGLPTSPRKRTRDADEDGDESDGSTDAKKSRSG